MGDNTPTMPVLAEMIAKDIGVREWLTYYRNVWVRNLAARLIDVRTDVIKKKKDPEEVVEHYMFDENIGQNRTVHIPVKERLEMRKILVQDCVDLLEALDELDALSDEELAKTYAVEGLAVDKDMLPPQVGDQCTTEAGGTGTLQDDSKGGLTCVAAVQALPVEEAKPVDPTVIGVDTAVEGGDQSTESVIESANKEPGV